MRVLHCIPGMQVGGAERQLGLLAPAQLRDGIDAHVALLRGGPNLSRLSEGNVPVHMIGANGNHDPVLVLRLVALIRHMKPDIVQTWFRQMDLFGGLAARATGRAWVVSERSSALAYRESWKDRILRAGFAARSDAIVANSPAGRQYWLDKTGDRTIVAVVPNAVPVDDILAAPVVTAFPGDDRPVVLVAGRLTQEKNLGVLLDAFAIASRSSRFRVLICGEGPSSNEISRKVTELKLNDLITMDGMRTDLWGLMKSAAVLVSASLFEGHPNVVLEAAAAGCPLVLSEIDAHRNALSERSAAFFNSGSAADLARVLTETLHDRKSAATRAANALHEVRAHSLDGAVAGYRNIYEQILARKS